MRHILKRYLSVVLVVVMITGSIGYAEGTDAVTGSCGEHATYVLEDGVLTISGTGAMKNSGPLGSILGYDTITSIVIEEGITRIGGEAFYNCVNLKSVTIPASVESIGYAAFNNCTSLTAVTFLEEGLTEIQEFAFAECTSLTRMILPDTVKTIGDSAFNGCDSLVYIKMPANLTYLGWWVFYNCINLRSMDLPSGITNIGDCTFGYCTSLVMFSIPETVTSIDSSAFEGCTGLTTIGIPENVTTIGFRAFNGCTNLTKIIIPETVTTMDERIFENCENVTIYGVEGSVAETYATTYDIAFVPSKGSCGEDVTYYLVGECVLKISGTGAMTDEFRFDTIFGTSMIQTVIIEDGVTHIGSNAFMNQECLTKVSIPKSVTTIGENAFYDCWTKISIVLPGNVTEIGENAFWNFHAIYGVPGSASEQYATANGLEFIALNENTVTDSVTLVVRGKDGTMIEDGYTVNWYGHDAEWNEQLLTTGNVLEGIVGNGEYVYEIIVGDELAELYISKQRVEYYVYEPAPMIEEVYLILNEGKCGDDVTYSLKDGVMTISGTGAMYDYGYPTERSKFSNLFGNDLIVSVVVEDGVAYIGANAFESCYQLQNVILAESVTNIGYNAFAYCDKLTSVAVSNSASSLKEIEVMTVSEEERKIGAYAFNSCSSLNTIIIPEGITTIDENAFYNCPSLVNVTLPESLTTIGYGAFNYCSGLENLTIPENVTFIDDTAFANCQNLIIYGVEGSYAEEYATNTNMTFVPKPTYIRGDVNEDGTVTADDAIYLLYHTLDTKNEYPINQSGDMNGDGGVTADDAIYLLYHTLDTKNEYPLVN